MKLSISVKNGGAIACMAGLVAFTGSCLATAASGAGWENDISIYGWLSDISGETKSGQEFTYDIDDILDSMEMVFMGNYEGRINKWSIIADVVYLDVSDDGTTNSPAGSLTGDIDLTTWVLSGGVGYDVIQSDQARLAVVAGVRYLDLELETDLSVGGTQVNANSGSQDLLDGTIGLRGFVKLGEGWFLPYYADVGTGDSDVSYQLFGGIGYKFSWGDVRVGYRHLYIEMEDDKVMSDLTVSGPIIGVGFKF